MMAIFLRLLKFSDKEKALSDAIDSARGGASDERIIAIDLKEFQALPGSALAYWLPSKARTLYQESAFDSKTEGRGTRCGLGTLDDFRFLRLRWEINASEKYWVSYYHGGIYSIFYDNFPLYVNWKEQGREIKTYVETKVGSASRKVQGEDKYFTPGFVFPRRTRAFCPKFMPSGGIFSTAGQAGFAPMEELPAIIALLSSSVCCELLTVSQGTTSQEGGGTNPQFEVGQVKRLPWPKIKLSSKKDLEALSLRGWLLKRTLSTANETSEAFLLPENLRNRLENYFPLAIEQELRDIQSRIDAIAIDLYGFSNADRGAAQACTAVFGNEVGEGGADGAGNDEDSAAPVSHVNGLLSWAVGVAFGRFDWCLATGERVAPPAPGAFDPLPATSPGMLPPNAEPFHRHPGILVDEPGHSHDLARLMEEVLVRVDAPVPLDVRRWLQRDFFPFHQQRYSKSRRKAPIYWPLSTASGSYTLWLYHPALTDQTLYTAVNDFIVPKLEGEVRPALRALRTSTSRTRDEERRLEQLQDLDTELQELQDELLRLASTWKPNHDDGVQITAAPLWRLFRHRPWQTVLKETWESLEKGDHDWAHLAVSYWPDRVREKCRTDKSLAIAHNLEALYQPPPEKPGAGRRGRKRMALAS